MKFSGKTVLITGASSGIGKAFALKIAADKPNLILISRREEKLAEVAAMATELGAACQIVPLDISDSMAVESFFTNYLAAQKPLDFVFNNAGLGYIAPLVDQTVDQIRQQLEVNVVGMTLVSKFAAQIMLQQEKGGHIVITSSVAGLVPTKEWSVYSESKWAATGLGEVMSMELAQYNIIVTTLHPGPVKTEFFDPTKANRDVSKVPMLVTAEHVAALVYKAAFTTKRRIYVPRYIYLVQLIYRFFPGLFKFASQNFKL